MPAMGECLNASSCVPAARRPRGHSRARFMCTKGRRTSESFQSYLRTSTGSGKWLNGCKIGTLRQDGWPADFVESACRGVTAFRDFVRTELGITLPGSHLALADGRQAESRRLVSEGRALPF